MSGKLEIESMDLRMLINSIYNYVDGIGSLESIESHAKEIDKKYYPDDYCGDVDVSKELPMLKKRTS